MFVNSKVDFYLPWCQNQVLSVEFENLVSTQLYFEAKAASNKDLRWMCLREVPPVPPNHCFKSVSVTSVLLNSTA